MLKVMSSFKRAPIVIILGSTATGKSKLGIEIAKAFNGEIISADSMQVYVGLDVITNKVSAAERLCVRHHMIDVVSPRECFSVLKFRDRALGIIDKLITEEKMPVVVGGTNYYVEALLWDFLIANGDKLGTSAVGLQERKAMEFRKRSCSQSTGSLSDEAESSPPCKMANLDSGLGPPHAPIIHRASHSSSGASNEKFVNSFEMNRLEDEKIVDSKELFLDAEDSRPTECPPSRGLFEELLAVDPVRASQLHPNDVRKISRSLQVFKTCGRRHSDLLVEQKQKQGSSRLAGPLRFENALIFWLTCQQDELDKRILARSEDMINRGLAQEIDDFHKNILTHPDCHTESSSRYVDGVAQAIGLKEFDSYLKSAGQDEESRKKLLVKGLDALRRVTIKYSKKQVSWIRNRFLGRSEKEAPPVYELDTSDLQSWDSNVLQKALHITQCFLAGSQSGHEPLARLTTREALDVHAKFVCDTCKGRVIIGDASWKAHLKSKKHKKAASSSCKQGTSAVARYLK